MGIAKLYGQKASGMNINGIVMDYYAATALQKGDLVKIINQTQVRKTTTSQFDGVAKVNAVEGAKVNIYTLGANFITRDGDAIMTADNNTFLVKQ